MLRIKKFFLSWLKKNGNVPFPNFWQAIFLLLALLLFDAIVTLIYVLAIIQIDESQLNNSTSNVYQYAILLGDLSMVLLILIINKKNQTKFIDGFKGPINIKQVSLVFFIGIITIIVGFPFSYIIDYIHFFQNGTLSHVVSFKPIDHKLELLGTIIVTPIIEEYLFRGQILHQFLKKYSVKFSIIGAAIIFTISHFSLFPSLGIFFYGIVFSIVYYKTNSIILVILLHSLVNIFIELLLRNFAFFEPHLFFSSQYFVVYFASLLTLYYCLKYLDKFSHKKKDLYH